MHYTSLQCIVIHWKSAEFSELLCERSLQLLQWKVPAISTKLCLHQLINIAFPYPSIHLCKILFPKALSSYSHCHSLKNQNNRSVYTQNTGHVLYITPICGTNHHFFLFISIKQLFIFMFSTGTTKAKFILTDNWFRNLFCGNSSLQKQTQK